MSIDREPGTRPATDSGAGEERWLSGHRWTAVAALIFVVILAVCVAVLTSRHAGDGPSSAPAPAGGATAPAATSSTSPSTTASTAVPTTAPPGTQWSIYENVALPTVPGAGPAHVDGAIATGYAHTPLGALLADVNTSYRYQLAGDNAYKQAAKAMLAKGSGYDEWLRVRAKNQYGSAGANPDHSVGQLAAFQFVSYNSDDAVIQLVSRGSSGSLQVGTQHLQWDGATWRLVLGASGGDTANVQQVTSLDGFVEWRGV